MNSQQAWDIYFDGFAVHSLSPHIKLNDYSHRKSLSIAEYAFAIGPVPIRTQKQIHLYELLTLACPIGDAHCEHVANKPTL